MARWRTIIPVIAVLLLATPVARAPSAIAQQNPFVGTWSASLMTPSGAGYSAFLDFYSDGTLHLSGLVTGGGEPMHEWGIYQVDTAQSLLQYVFRDYAPRKCAYGLCEPGPPNLNQVFTARYQFPNPNQFILSDGTTYVRQLANPYPDPNR